MYWTVDDFLHMTSHRRLVRGLVKCLLPKLERVPYREPYGQTVTRDIRQTVAELGSQIILSLATLDQVACIAYRIWYFDRSAMLDIWDLGQNLDIGRSSCVFLFFFFLQIPPDGSGGSPWQSPL